MLCVEGCAVVITSVAVDVHGYVQMEPYAAPLMLPAPSSRTCWRHVAIEPLFSVSSGSNSSSIIVLRYVACRHVPSAHNPTRIPCPTETQTPMHDNVFVFVCSPPLDQSAIRIPIVRILAACKCDRVRRRQSAHSIGPFARPRVL